MNGGVDAAHAAVVPAVAPVLPQLMGAGSEIIAQVVTAAATAPAADSVAAAVDAAGGGDGILDGSALILLSALCFGVHVFRTDVIFGESGLGAAMTTRQAMVGRCRLTRINPHLTRLDLST